MSSITHTEGSSVSQQTGVGDAPNIIIMENNIINCGDPNYIHLTSHHHLHNQQQAINTSVSNKKGPKQTVTSQNKFNKSTAINKQIITNTNLITSKEKVFNVQTGRGPKTMYTQQVYTTIPSSPTSSASIVQQQKITTMPRNVQVVTKGSNNMILCRSPSNSGSSNGNTQIQIQEQQYHHIDGNQQAQPAYTTMKTIYVNNNSGGLNLNKSNKIMTSISPLDYSSENIKQPQTKYITQKVVQSSPTSDLADNKYAFKFTTSVSSPSTSGQTQVVQQNSSGNSNKGMIKNYNNNCTVKSIQQTSQPAFYYQPTTVYTSDAINYKTSSATIKGNNGGKNQGQQYIQVSQNHRISTNNYTPAPVQKHRTSSSSSSSGKYIIQSVAPPSQNNPVSSSNQQVRYTTTTNNQTSVISYSTEQPSVIQSPIKMRTVLHPIESTGMEDGARIYTVSEAHPDEVDSSSSGTPKSYNSSNFSENYMIVNGTKMTDEMSARILHDLSQRSSVKYNNTTSNTNNNNNNQHSNNSNSNNNSGGGGSEIIQISQQPSGTIYSTRQPDGTTVVWNSSATSMNPSETKYLTTTQEQLTSNSNRKISESSNNYVNPAYQHDYRGVNNR